MANPAPTINQINAFNATQGTTIDFNIIGGTELVRSNRIYIYDLSDNSLICTHLYVSTESIHELPANTDSSMVYESGKSSADFVNGAQYYAQIQTFTDIGGTEGGSGLSVAKMFWCLDDPTLTIDTIPSTISTTSYNVSATYDANTSVVSNIIQQYQFSLYSATGSLLQSSGVVVGNGEQQGTSTAYDISYNFTGLSVGSSYYVVVDVTTTQGMSVSTQSGTFTVSIDTPTLGEATVVNNACDGYISVTSNLSSEYGGSGSGEIVSFETDSENVFTKLQVTFNPTQSGSGTASPDNERPIYGVGEVEVVNCGKNLFDGTLLNGYYNAGGSGGFVANANWRATNKIPCKASTTYVMSGSSYSGGSYNGAACFWDINGNYLGYRGTGANFMSYPNSAFMAVYLGTSYVTDSMQIEQGSTATAYEPYTETTVSQEFDVSLTPTSKDTDPYLFKAVGDIYGDRLEEDIVGGTVNWNQLAYNPNFASASGWTGRYATINVSNNIATLTVSSSGTKRGLAGNYSSGSTFTSITHKYLLSVDVLSPIDSSLELSCMGGANNNVIRPTVQANVWKTCSVIWYPLLDNTYKSNLYALIYGTTEEGQEIQYKNPIIVDLTAYFGNATIADAIYNMEQAQAGSGIALLKASGFFNEDMPYDAGTLKSVNPTAHKMVGVNQWDEEWRNGIYSTTTGAFEANSNYFANKNPIRVLPNTTYYIGDSRGATFRICEYEHDGSFVKTENVTNGTFTTSANTWYINFNGATTFYGTTYNHDICINISNTEINGQYYPYEEHTYPLGDVTLRGKFELVNGELKAVGDIYKHDGSVTRKIVHLPQGVTYTLVNTSSTGYKTYSYNTSNARVAGNTYPITNFGLKGVISFSSATVNEECIQLTAPTASSNASIYFAIASTRDIADFVMEYELATPTTETTTPFTQIQKVSKYGTLEYITTNDIPVGHNTTYYTRDVFGGYIDLVSGQLVVTHTVIDGGTLNWIYWTNNSFYASITGKTATSMADVLCDIYPTADNMTTDKSIYCLLNNDFQLSAVYINDSTLSADASGATALKERLNGHMIWYRLATPLTYQLTPQQIQTLVGVNNVWSEQGDIELAYHIPITNLLVKRQDVDDVSGNWLTLYSQPVEQASDMDFTFIDFLNQYGKTYKYALVPLLTQTQSGVEVEVEGGYTVSDEVQSIFDGVFISDSTGSQKCKANVGYGNVNMNQAVGSITPIGSQYPIIVTNSNNRYHNGSISGMIVPDDYYYNGNLSRIDMVNKRNELEQFLTNKRAKIIKDWNSNIWLVMIMDNIDCSFDNNYGMGIVTFNANWLEIGDPTNQEDLQATGLVDVGGV